MQVFDYGRELLKWIAILTMTVDHVGAVLYPELEFLRWIGRLSFPLFAYLLMLGLESTRNVRNYFVRLFVFALISQVPFFLAIDKAPFDMFNIFFTLSFGLMFVDFFRKGQATAVVPLLISLIMPIDYGVYGIAVIGCMYFLIENPKLGVILLVLLNMLFLLPPSSQILSLAAIPLILLHKNGFISVKRINNDKDFRIPLWRKYFFYGYYPLHLGLLYMIKMVYF
jgi:hypothetical protein